MKSVFDTSEPGKCQIFYITNGAGVLVTDPKVVEAMYTTKNKFFDKHVLVKDISRCLTGDSILFAETTLDWRQSRKALSPAFYKGKLENLVEIAKQAVKVTHANFDAVAAKGPRSEIDIMSEINNMTTRILIVCAFGIDISDELVDFYENGRLT